MKKLVLFLLLVIWLFFSHTFAVVIPEGYFTNSMLLQTQNSNNANDYIFLDVALWWYYSYNPYVVFYSPIRWVSNWFIEYALTSPTAIQPFSFYLTWWHYLTWLFNSFPSNNIYRTVLSTGIVFPNIESSTQIINSSFFVFNHTNNSLGFFSNRGLSHWFYMGNGFSSALSNYDRSQWIVSIYNSTEIASASLKQQSYRWFTDYWYADQHALFNLSWEFQPLNFTPNLELVQVFKSDWVDRYHQGTNVSLWSAYSASTNSQYFLWPWNAFSYVSPSLDMNWNGTWGGLKLWATQNVVDWTGQGTQMIPENLGALVISPNGFGTNTSTYNHKVVIISKDSSDSKKLLGWIYNCDVALPVSIANQCVALAVGHWQWKIATNDGWQQYTTCSTTWYTWLLPYSTTSSTVWLNLNTARNIWSTASWWSAHYLSDSYCNPIPDLFFHYQRQNPWWTQKTFIADTSLNWSTLCFNGTASKNCINLLQDTTINPLENIDVFDYSLFVQDTNTWSILNDSYWLNHTSTWSNLQNNYSQIYSILAQYETKYGFQPVMCSTWNSILYTENQGLTSAPIVSQNITTTSPNSRTSAIPHWVYFTATKSISLVSFTLMLNENSTKWHLSTVSWSVITEVKNWWVSTQYPSDTYNAWLISYTLLSWWHYLLTFDAQWVSFTQQFLNSWTYPTVLNNGITLTAWLRGNDLFSSLEGIRSISTIDLSTQVYIWNGTYSFTAYNSWLADWLQALRSYCAYRNKVLNHDYSLLTWSSQTITNTIMYWSGFDSPSWLNSLFNCPSAYKTAVPFKLTISDLSFGVIPQNTTIWDLNLISPVACLIWAFNYWFWSWSFTTNQTTILSQFSGFAPTTIIFWTDFWHSERLDLSWFTTFLGIILSIPAVYLAFKLLL